MNSEQISKKDLLKMTGISYGQLYRWKRKDLIPEDWFIRKSTFTGQETFFPKEEILERIAKIQSMKENASLDDLANIFSPDSASFSFDRKALLATELVSTPVLELYVTSANHKDEQFGFEEIMAMYTLEKLLQSGDVSLEEGKMVLQLFCDFYLPEPNHKTVLVVTRKMGVSSALLSEKVDSLHLEKGTKVIGKVDFMYISEELKAKLVSKFDSVHVSGAAKEDDSQAEA